MNQKLWKYETGSKTALPIFKSFIKNAVKKENARPFKVAKNVEMMVIDSVSGKKADFGSAETIIESFKKNTIEKNIFSVNDLPETGKSNILKFY